MRKDPDTHQHQNRLLILGVTPSSIGQQECAPLEMNGTKGQVIIRDAIGRHQFTDKAIFSLLGICGDAHGYIQSARLGKKIWSPICYALRALLVRSMGGPQMEGHYPVT